MSSIPIVKAAVMARLKADASLAEVQVKYGHPYPAEPTSQMLFFGDAIAGDPTNGQTPYGGGQRSAALGQKRREERYVLHGYMVVTLHNAEDQQTATERAYGFVQVVEDSLRLWGPQSTDWPQIAGGGPNGVHWVLVSSIEHAEGKDNTATRCAVHIELAVAARI